MAVSKIISLLILLLLSVQSFAQKDSTNNKKILSCYGQYISEYRTYNYKREIKTTMWLPNTLITGDTLLKFYAAKGYRVGFNQLFPIKKFLDNNFSLTTGLWFQQEFGHKDILVTSNLNSAGFRKVKENTKGNSLAILLSLDYHYYKIKYSIGFNFDLYYNEIVTALYEDKTQEVVLTGPASSHSIYYFAMRFPILAKYNLYGLGSVSFLLQSRMYLSLGLNYDIANFEKIKK